MSLSIRGQIKAGTVCTLASIVDYEYYMKIYLVPLITLNLSIWNKLLSMVFLEIVLIFHLRYICEVLIAKFFSSTFENDMRIETGLQFPGFYLSLEALFLNTLRWHHRQPKSSHLYL